MLVRYGKFIDESIRCPACQCEYIHHDTVTIFERKTEDAPSHAIVVERIGQVSNITGAKAKRGNPSSCRNGVAIRFWCECCDALSELTIEQHKGNTLLRWRSASDTKRNEPPPLSIVRCAGQ
jgi:hypothetical protein